VLDDDNLVSSAGLVPVMTLAEQTGLIALLDSRVHIAEPGIASGSADPAPKLATVIAGMCAGADSIDDLEVVRSGGMKTLSGDQMSSPVLAAWLRLIAVWVVPNRVGPSRSPMVDELKSLVTLLFRNCNVIDTL
jgi:hypothetical protein